MSKIKRILAVVMAVAMVMAMGLVSFATEGDTPAAPTAVATVKGVTEEGAVVTAYQLVTYNANGGYEVVPAAADKGYSVGSVDAAVVAALAQNTGGLEGTTLVKQENGDYTANLTAGTYLVLVTNSGSTIYNPMLVSLEVHYPEGVQPGEVDADTNYEVDGQTVYAKSTTNVPVDKKITDADGNTIGIGGVYDDVYTGTTVYFTLTGKIPSYSASYTNAAYILTDTASSGLDLPANLKGTIESQLDANAAEVTVNERTITIAFNTAYILANGNKDIRITYPATVNGTASNFNAATNTLEVNYSNAPGSTTSGTSVETHHYTFDLNNVLVKVDSDQTTTLTGAEFTLTSTTDQTKSFRSISDANGNINFTGLDAGTYTLVETKAPAGYALSGKEYTVTITPTYNNAGILTSYTVTTTTMEDGEVVPVGEFSYSADNQTGTGRPANIVNTTLGELPTTGGIGTTIFTIIGCLIMIGAAFMFFMCRRKNDD